MSFVLHGIAASKGIAIGKVHIIHRDKLEVSEYSIPRQYVEQEINRFERAIENAHQQLMSIRDNILKGTNPDVIAFIDTYLLMLNDSLISEGPIRIIRERQCNAEWALKLQCDTLLKVFDDMEDPYLSTRKNDVEQVVARVQRILRGYTELPVEYDEAHVHNSIILTDDLSPEDTALMQHRGILAFATEHGGMNSHTAILARSLGIPAIVGLRRALPYIRQEDTLIVDGFHGVLLANPDERSILYYQTRQREERRYRATLNKIKTAPCITEDSIPITLMANIEFPEDMTAVRRVGGKGIGLYRTEFLFMNRDQPPTEEEHLDAYMRVINALDKEDITTIRTMDLGGDKQVENMTTWHQKVTNPALGLRAIRLCLKENRLFKPQVRAILRASAYGRVRMMLPMITIPQEMVQVRNFVQEVRQELDQKNIPYNPQMPIGAMIEVPAMAVCADLFMPYSDFFSIGTNDLIQYALAIDRVDDQVNYLYDPLHPAVLRLIKMSIDAANKAEKPIAMCGEMASDSRYVRILLGLGLRAFSVNPEGLLEVKQIVNNSDTKSLTRLCNRLLKVTQANERQEILASINE